MNETDEQQTERLIAENEQRLERLNSQGRMVGGIDEHYTHLLLEYLISELAPGRLEEVKLEQQTWLSSELNRIEAAVRTMALTQPPQMAQRLTNS